MKGRGSSVIRHLLANRVAALAVGVLGVLVLVAVFGPLLPLPDPNDQELTARLLGPRRAHLLGTDEFGRDQLARLVAGTRVSLIAALEVAAISCGIGTPLGLLTGYVGGPVARFADRVNEALMSVPALILALTLVAVLGPGLVNAMLAVGIIFIPRFYRVARAAAQALRSEVFVDAARAVGCGTARILVRHVVPHAVPPILVQLTLTLGAAVTAEASLSFLGLGVRPPQASWGAMLSNGASLVATAPHLVYPPGVAIAVLVATFGLVGDGLRRALGVHSSSGVEPA